MTPEAVVIVEVGAGSVVITYRVDGVSVAAMGRDASKISKTVFDHLEEDGGFQELTASGIVQMSSSEEVLATYDDDASFQPTSVSVQEVI